MTASFIPRLLKQLVDVISTLAPTKGKLLTGDGSKWDGVAVGTNGLPLVADSGEALGVKYAALTPAGGGTGATAFTLGSVVFAGTSGVYAQDNANLFWDDTNNRLGILTASPAGGLHVNHRQTYLGLYPVGIGQSGSEYPGIGYNVEFQTAGSSWKYKASDTATLLRFGSGNGSPSSLAYEFKCTTVGTAGNAITWTTPVTIRNDGLLTATNGFSSTNGVTIGTTSQIPALTITHGYNSDVISVTKSTGTGQLLTYTTLSAQSGGISLTLTDANTYQFNAYTGLYFANTSTGYDSYVVYGGWFQASQTRNTAGTNGGTPIGVWARASTTALAPQGYGVLGDAMSARVVPVCARMSASQTANAFEIQNSVGAALHAISALGYLGLGTPTPVGLIDASSNTVNLGQTYFTQANASADGFDQNFRKARGTKAVPTVITTGDELGVVNFTGYGGAAGFITGGAIKGISSGTIADSRVPGFLSFWAATDTAPSVLTEGMRVLATGGQVPRGGAATFANVGGSIFDQFADASVGGAEADIYTNTLDASLFSTNGDKVTASYGGNFVTLGTELTQLLLKLAGTTIWDSTGVAPSTGTTSWRVAVELIRVSATVIRYVVSLNTTGASGYVYCTCGELTGLTLTNTNILVLRGASSGVGSGAGDIVGKMGFVEFKKAA